MPIIDRKRFPKLIIQIPEEEYPDKLKIVVTGRPQLQGGAGKTAQLASEAKSGSLGQPVTPTYFTKTYTESDFKKTINGKKTAELKTPYDEIVNTIGYGHREDPEDETPINVSMFTTTQSSQPSARNTTYNLQGVFAYNFTMVKYNMDSQYITQYVKEATPVGQGASVASQFTQYIPQVIAAIVNPSLPTPKQIASKVLGPAAAPVQKIIAENAKTIATIKKEAEKAKRVVNAVKNIASDPSSVATYIPVLIGYLIKWIGQDKIAKVVYSFRG
jgi:hypothetical protein